MLVDAKSYSANACDRQTVPRRADPFRLAETGLLDLLDEDPAVSIYDGRICLGFIFDRSTGCVATDAGRRPLGRFATWREASVAIHEARRALEVAG